MNSVRRAFVYTAADRYFSLTMNFGVIAAVSRLLTPAEIGISVTGSAIIGLAVSLREFASAEFLIQRVNLSREDVRAAFTVMLALTLLISGVLFLSAPLIAELYGEDGLVLYLRVVSACILTEVATAAATALMRRDMAFGQVALVHASAAAVGAGATIGLVLLEFSYMSFAWGWLLSSTFGGILAVRLGGHLWILKPIFRNWKDMLVFGSYNGLNYALYRIYEQVPYLFLGRLLSFDATALFHRTWSTAQLPDKVFLGGALSVVFPAFSLEVRNGGDLKRPYLTALAYITAVQWPALVVLAILIHPIVLILYGNQWLDIVPLVQIVAVASLFSFSFNLNYEALLAFGAVREILLRSLIIWPASALLLVAAAPFGLHAVASSFLVAIPLQAYVSFLFVRRHIPISWWELAHALRKSALVTMGAAAGPALVVVANGRLEISPLMAVGAAVLSGIGWVLAIRMVRHPALQELERAINLVGWPGMLRRQTG